MNFSIERPVVFFGLFALVPTILYIIYRFKRLENTLSNFYKSEKDFKYYRHLKRSLLLRTAFRSLSWIFAICACAGISWGSKNVPIQKSGYSVCFVFDISYSMNAKDGSNGNSRLEDVAFYASTLLQNMEGVSVSAVLAKGDGFIAVPSTEDTASLQALIENLSPKLMTSAGSSIGKGIEAAFNAFPVHSARSNFIWVFTDGDETDKQLENALEDAVKFGIPLTLVGFGSEKGTEVLTGDEKTSVKTYLQSEKMRRLSDKANRSGASKLRKQQFSNEGQKLVRYVRASSAGSAYELLNQIANAKKKNQEEASLDYETVEVKRHIFFLLLSVLSFMLSFVAGEIKVNTRKSSVIAAVFMVTELFTSCKSEKKAILRGSWSWYQGKYKRATAEFLNTTYKFHDDFDANQYAIFGLASTYISLEEYDAAIERLNQLSLSEEKLPASFVSASYYNYGIIYERRSDFDTASEYFKKAIKADPSNVNAKINLELCNRQLAEKQSKNGEAEMRGVDENHDDSQSSMRNELFNLIREKENNQWKKLQSNHQENSVLDY